MSQKQQISAEKIIDVVREYKARKAGAANLAQRSGANENVRCGVGSRRMKRREPVRFWRAIRTRDIARS